jgi:NitT/TauT family transport system substrate-binding protein
MNPGGGDQLLARQEIGSITQLRGRRVGVTFSTLGPYVLSRALEREGLSLGDVEVRNVSLASMPAAIANGSLDAVVLFPPYSELAARQGRSKRLFDSSSIPGEIFDVLVVSPAYLAEQKDALVLLLRAWQAAHGLARQEPEATATLLARREGISVPEFRGCRKGFDLLLPGGAGGAIGSRWPACAQSAICAGAATAAQLGPN